MGASQHQKAPRCFGFWLSCEKELYGINSNTRQRAQKKSRANCPVLCRASRPPYARAGLADLIAFAGAPPCMHTHSPPPPSNYLPSPSPDSIAPQWAGTPAGEDGDVGDGAVSVLAGVRASAAANTSA